MYRQFLRVEYDEVYRRFELCVSVLYGAYPAGSMGPKAEACANFVERTGGRAVIGALGQAAEIVVGRAGTQVVPDTDRGHH